MMPDIGQEKACRRLVDDQPEVAAGPHRPEIRVAGAIDPMELQSRPGRVHLQVERRCLGGLLLLRLQAGESCREGVGYKEFHYRLSVLRLMKQAVVQLWNLNERPGT